MSGGSVSGGPGGTESQGNRVDVTVNAPVDPGSIVRGDTLRNATVEVKQSTVDTTQQSVSATVGLGVDASVDASRTDKRQSVASDWRGNLGDARDALVQGVQSRFAPH